MTSDGIMESSAKEFVSNWCHRLEDADAKFPIEELYCGRGFSEFVNASKQIENVDKYVISAGLGLVQFGIKAPNYNITTSLNSNNSILKRFDLQAKDWWRCINLFRHGCGNPLSQAILDQNIDIAFLCVSKSYTPLIEADFEAISPEDLNKVRLIGPIGAKGLSKKMQDVLMPYSHHLDGPDSPIPGTKADFAQRAFSHFVTHVYLPNQEASLSDHRKMVKQAMASLTAPNMKFDRIKLTDEEVVTQIEIYWEKCEGKSGATLRYLRDQGYACEQSRFAQLFREVRNRKLECYE